MVQTFNVDKYLLVSFNWYGFVCSDKAIHEWMNSDESLLDDGSFDEDGLVERVVEACHRDGFEYVRDARLAEAELLDYDNNIVLLTDWIRLMNGDTN